MEKTENMITVHPADIHPAEINEVRTTLYTLMGNRIAEDSPLVEALLFIFDTLEAGKSITIFSRLAPEEYVLTH